MIVTVHQPMFLPYEGFWSKVLQADRLILMMNTPWSKGDGTNRVRLHPQGQWLTLPVSTATKNISDCQYTLNGVERVIKTLRQEFLPKRYPFAARVHMLLDQMTKEAEDCHGQMAVLNYRMLRAILWMLKEYGPVPELVVDTVAGDPTTSTTARLMRLIERHEPGPCTYLSGSAGVNYLEPSEIPAQIKVRVPVTTRAQDQTVLQLIALATDPLAALRHLTEFGDLA